jgi:hypothetical protein
MTFRCFLETLSTIFTRWNSKTLWFFEGGLGATGEQYGCLNIIDFALKHPSTSTVTQLTATQKPAEQWKGFDNEHFMICLVGCYLFN